MYFGVFLKGTVRASKRRWAPQNIRFTLRGVLIILNWA